MDNISKNTLVIGGSPKAERYSNKAIKKLLKYNHKVFSIGLKESAVNGVNIETGHPEYKNIHTVTMYVGELRQNSYIDYVVDLKPQRVIFNPGSENMSFADKLKNNNIEVIENCTLVMLDYGLF